MKRLAALVLLTSVALCSSAKAMKAESGMIAGINYAKTSSKELDHRGTRVAYSFGAYAAFTPITHVTLQAGTIFSRKGEKIYNDGRPATLEMDYVDIPFLVIVRPFDWYLVPYALGGFAMGINVDSRMKVGDITRDLTIWTHTWDKAWVYGFGLDIMNSVTIEARWTHGISDAMSEFESDELCVRNRVMSILLGYHF
jgi:hypothetical protein